MPMEELMQNHAGDPAAPRSKSDLEDRLPGGLGDRRGGRR
jgi:hypothetical protein